MVADNANISGSKLDIDSVIETINDDGTKTISGTKVYLDEQKQTLEVAFEQMHTTIEDDIKEQITTNTNLAVKCPNNTLYAGNLLNVRQLDTVVTFAVPTKRHLHIGILLLG